MKTNNSYDLHLQTSKNAIKPGTEHHERLWLHDFACGPEDTYDLHGCIAINFHEFSRFIIYIPPVLLDGRILGMKIYFPRTVRGKKLADSALIFSTDTDRREGSCTQRVKINVSLARFLCSMV